MKTIETDATGVGLNSTESVSRPGEASSHMESRRQLPRPNKRRAKDHHKNAPPAGLCPSTSQSNGESQAGVSILGENALSTASPDGGLNRFENRSKGAPIREIREHFAQWEAIVRSQTRQTNATLAFVRRAIGYESRMEEKERDRVAALAKKIVGLIEDGKPIPPELQTVAETVRPFVECSMQGGKPFDDQRARVEERMIELADTLPGAAFAKSVRAFGLKALAKIIGMTGDLTNYATPCKVWRRLSLAPFQGKAGSTWRREGGLNAEQWTEFGYSPGKSAIMFTIGDVLIKMNGPEGEYRKLYDSRKAYELAREPDMQPMKAHRRAQRYMVKRLILNLWKAWRDKTKATVGAM